MTVKPAIVLARLAHLGQVLAVLERLRTTPAVEREADSLYVLAAERALHIAFEAIFDIGHHILAGRGCPIPPTYRDVLPALAKEGVVGADLVQRLTGIAGLRNLLVHDYADVDPSQIWLLIDRRLDDLRMMQDALANISELKRG